MFIKKVRFAKIILISGARDYWYIIEECKVKFNQPSCWLYSVPNLLVIQHLETLYLGGIHVKVVCERV